MKTQEPVRPYPPEPRTHYDGADDHGYAMHDVLDPPELNDLAQSEIKQQKVSINGVEHYLAWYGEPDRYGARPARLRRCDIPF